LELFYGVYRQDADAVIAALIDLGIIVPTADAVSLRRAISFSLDNLLRKVSSCQISWRLFDSPAAAVAAISRLTNGYEWMMRIGLSGSRGKAGQGPSHKERPPMGPDCSGHDHCIIRRLLLQEQISYLRHAES
jgi:hypothetical protein